MDVPYKLAVLVQKLKDSGCIPIRNEGEEFRCRCPAHADNGPSLYIRLTEDRILLNCKAGCTVQAVCDRLDHDIADLFFGADESTVDWDLGVAVTGDMVTNVASGQEPTVSAPVVGNSNLRQAVYKDLLAALELNTKHFDDLRKRGLTAERIAAGCYKTIEASKIRTAIDGLLAKYGTDKLVTVPGFVEKDGSVLFLGTKGFLIPVRGLDGNIVAIKVRHDAGYNGAKYTYASSKDTSCGSPVHVPLGISAPSKMVRVTEGELKADIAIALSGVPTISAPGINNWRLVVPVLHALGAKKVLLAMDQDGKRSTVFIVEKALFGLAREGFDVELECWDGKVAKGIDDLLAVGKQPEVVTGLAAAVRIQDAVSPESSEKEAAEVEPPPFPMEVLPPALMAFCHEVADATSTPPDFAALTMLVVAGAAIGNSRAICIKENVWYESPRFYAANVGDPASGKTPAMDAVVKPYQAMQHKLLKDFKNAKAEYDKAMVEYEKSVKENRALPEEERKPLPTLPDEPEKPERFVVVDATIESLAPLLEENPRGLLMPQDEGVAWVRGMGQYKGGRGNDRQFWLSNWSGKSHIVDRKCQGGVPISIPRPFVNVVCGLPPDMLNELADYQGRNDGFLHRILFVFPRASAGTDWTDATVTKESRETWSETLTNLRKLAMQDLDDGVAGFKVVKLAPSAKETWITWWNAHAGEIRGADLPLPLVGPWGKLKAYAARLILVLYYLWLVQTDEDEGDIGAATVERAIRVIDYLKAHLQLVYGQLRQTPAENHLLEVLDWIRKAGGQCTPRELVRAKKVSPTDKARKLLKELEDRGYGHIEWRDAKNGKKVMWFLFDPA